jgi:hypothetical protein
MNWRGGLTTAGWVVVGILLTLVGLQLHKRFLAPDGPQVYDASDTRVKVDILGPDGLVADPAAFLSDPVVDENLIRVKGDPLEIAPPTGAVRLRVDAFDSGGQRSHRASYQVDGEMDVVAAYYEWELGKRGFEAEPRSSGADGMRQFYFRGADHASVSLHHVAGEDTMVRITVIVSQSVRPTED